MIRWRRSTVMQSANRVTSVTSPRFQAGLSARSSARKGRGSAKIRRHASGRPGGWPQILGRQFHLGQVPGADRAVVMDQRRRRERSGRHDDLADDAQHLAGVAAKRAVSQAVSGQGRGGGVHQSARVRRPWLRWAWVTFSIMPFGGVVSDPLAAGAIPARSWARPIPARTRIIPLPPGVVRNGDPFKVLDVAVLWLEALEPGTGRSGRLYPDGDPGRSRRCPTHARAWPAGRRCGSRTGGAAPSARSGRTAGQGGRGDRSAPRRPHRPRAPSRDRSGDARSGPPAAPSGASRG